MNKSKAKKKNASPAANVADTSMLSRRHLQLGWWLLLLYLSLGIVLEGLHGFKVTSYLGVNAEVRRLMWTLAHTHGTLISLVHVAYSFTLTRIGAPSVTSANWASLSLTGAGVLMPVGFFLGGLFHYSGDPGLGILLVPPGGILLLISVFLIAREVTRKIDTSS